MKIAVFGAGYVGVTTAVCFAEMGHTVHCIDVIEAKVQLLMAGESVIFEPGLKELLQKNLATESLFFSTDALTAIKNADVIFITVGSPSDHDGSVDLSLVSKAAETIAQAITGYKLVVIKSTVPVGSQILIQKKMKEILEQQRQIIDFDIASNPEFLREGSAIYDCLNPDRIVIGTESEKAVGILKNIYASLITKNVPFHIMDSRSAEMTKYAANSLLAAKISLMNELSRLCEKTGADIDLVRQGIASDHRIGPHVLYAGLGYGGSCFPKDVRALQQMGAKNNESLQLLKAIETTNSLQKNYFIEKITNRLPLLSGKKIAVWGASFKPNTDDIREAPSLAVIDTLLNLGASVTIFDPAAKKNLSDYFQNRNNLVFGDDPYSILESCAALVIVTEWSDFLRPDFQRIKQLLISPLIFDGRNLFSPLQMKTLGFEYHSIGRATL